LHGASQDPCIKELAEQIAEDPSLNQMAEQLQKTLHGASQDRLPEVDNLKYIPIMQQVMRNRNLRTMARRLGNALMQVFI
jgi:hypothetical protein